MAFVISSVEMDVERTMQFILESQARAEARSDKADARFARAEARMDKAEKRSERELNAIRKLFQQGMKALAELTEAQRETDRALRAFIKSSQNGRNRRDGDNGH